MWPIKYFEKIRRMDDLIRTKATGNPDIFSKKVNLSRRALMAYLKTMKFLGFPIKYDKTRGTYYYEIEGKMTKDFFNPTIGREISPEKQKKITGGEAFFIEYVKCNHNALTLYNFV